MGKLVVTIGVGDQQGRQFEDLEVPVDTGSTFTAGHGGAGADARTERRREEAPIR